MYDTEHVIFPSNMGSKLTKTIAKVMKDAERKSGIKKCLSTSIEAQLCYPHSRTWNRFADNTETA
ncbi:MAG: hypothetical protein QXQ40_01385 [Candidatus Aenigmatarchaeota archaeon]